MKACGIVAGLVHVLDAEPVGFGLVRAGELEEGHGDRELRGLVDAVAGPGALGEDDERDGADLRVVHAGHLAGGVVGADVGGLVRHDAGELGLFVRGQDQAGVDVEEAAGQGHGVDLVGVDHLDGEGDLAVGVLDDVLADAVDVLDDDGVGDQVRGLLDLHGVLLADADLPVGGVPVAHAAAADVARADGVDVVLAARLDVGLRVLAGRWEDVGLASLWPPSRRPCSCFWLFGWGPWGGPSEEFRSGRTRWLGVWRGADGAGWAVAASYRAEAVGRRWAGCVVGLCEDCEPNERSGG